ncbi:MAG TPA: hypothetical protein VFZ61_18720 [Polyangiales bacterium]
MIEFESINPGIDPKLSNSGAGSCAGAIRTIGWPEHAPGPQEYALHALSGTEHVLFDPARGLAVIDTTGPRLLGRLPLPRSVGHLHISGSHAFLSRRNVLESAARFDNGYPKPGDEAELLAVDLSDPTRPRLAARLPLDRAPRLSMLATSGGTTRIYVLSDGGAARGCASFDDEERIDSFEWLDGKFVPRSQLVLGHGDRGHSAVAPLDEALAVVRRGASYETELSFVSFKASDGSMLESPRVRYEHIAALHADGQGALRMLASSGPGAWLLEAYDVRDWGAPMARSRCTFTQDLSYGPTSFAPHHVFVRAGQASDRSNHVLSIGMDQNGGCETRVHQGRGRGLHWLGEAAPERVLDIDSNAQGDVTVRVLHEADLRVLSEVSIPAAGEGWYAGRARRTRERADALLIPVGTQMPGATPGPGAQIQLLWLDANDRLSLAGPLEAAASVLERAEQPLVWRQGELARIDLTDPASPRLSAAIDVMPSFSQVVRHGDHWLRIRAPHELEHPEQLSAEELFEPARKASLELVPIDEDPDLGDAVGAIPVNPRARLVAGGGVQVAISRGYRASTDPRKPWSGPAEALFEVFDLSDVEHPVQVGELRVDSLWLADPCSDCTGSTEDTRDLMFDDKLVLRTLDAEGELELRVLDLRDPTQPVLHPPFERPERAPIVSVMAVDDHIAYTYAERSSGSSASERVRFYYRSVLLSDPAKPGIGEPVNVPGQLVAVHGDQLYTREIARDEAGSWGMHIHHLTLKDGKARLEASHAVGERHALNIGFDPSHRLLVDLREPLETLLYGTRTPITPTDVRVLDAATLKPVGEGHVGPGATRLGVLRDYALYGAAQGVVLMKLTPAESPRAQAYIPVASLGAGRGMLARDGFVIEDSGALKRYGLDTTNLPTAP